MVVEFAIIENDTVINRILATQEFMQSLGVNYTSDSTAQIGSALINGVWTPPAQEE